MADKWYEGFWAEFLRELGLEWWFHRKGRTPAGGTTGATVPQPQAPRPALVPKSLLEWVHSLPAKYRRGLEELPAEELESLLKLKQEEREAALIARFGLPPSLLESLRETAEKTKEKFGRLEQKIQSSEEAKAQLKKANDRLDRWARWLGRRDH